MFILENCQVLNNGKLIDLFFFYHQKDHLHDKCQKLIHKIDFTSLHKE